MESANGRDFAARRLVGLGRVELDRAYRLAGLILGSGADAEDATQEALLRAWRSAASLRDADGFDAWFDRILVNVCRDRLRRGRKVRWIALDPALHEGVDGDAFRAILERDALLATLRILEPDERAIVVLHYWADLTLDAVAERMGTPIGTVKSRLHRALERMRAEQAASDGPEDAR